MIIQDLSLQDPQQNLDADDELLRRADRPGPDAGAGDGEALRFWESPVHFVVLGRTCRADQDVDQEACHRDQIPVLRRSSGGGTVLQGPGCLNVALVLDKKRDRALETISGSYRYILDKIVLALATRGVRAAFRPVCDLALESNDKKFSGNAQRRGREYILHHGTILYHFDMALIPRYLRMPPRMPEYRRARSHEDFLTNITVDPAELRHAIINQFAGCLSPAVRAE